MRSEQSEEKRRVQKRPGPVGIIEITRHHTNSARGVGVAPRRGSIGFLPWEGHDDIRIETKDLNTALNGDTVEVEVRAMRPRPTGRVVKVLERARTEFVGTLKRPLGLWEVVPDDKRFYAPIRLNSPTRVLADTSAQFALAEDMKVMVRLLDWTKDGPQGEILEVLGKKDEHRVEMNAIILEHGFKTRFPEEALREARDIEGRHTAIIAEEAPRRRDFRDVTTFTVDPHDAKDFDDALSIRELEDGLFEIGIHIADVAHFVRPGMALEEEAKRRATSVYLVDATIPMLPEELSGNVCSLRQGEDRLTFSAVVKIDTKGRVHDRFFGRTIIRSHKRFTYEEAQGILDTGEGLFYTELNTLNEISKKLKEERVRAGAIEFDQDEVKFELDPSGKPLRVLKTRRIPTNMLIEEFMLLANREVATYVHTLHAKAPQSERVFIYRIHDVPQEDRIEELSIFLRAIGYELGKEAAGGRRPRLHAKDFNKLFKEIEGTPEESLIKTATIRSMAKAIYSMKNIGHFGLSFRHYTHFTSPIRRYPDMMVHRVLVAHLHGERVATGEFLAYEKLAIHSSEQEAKAVSAERESIKYKQVQFLREKVGQEFNAIISGVAEWGIYVEVEESKAEGLVRVKDIKGDYYVLDKKRYALVGTRTKKKYALGERVRVKLTSTDLDTRTLEFVLA